MKPHPAPKALAKLLHRLGDRLESSGALALERSEVLAARGYPSNTAGGVRSSDTTSSTERAALDPHEWDGVDDELSDWLQRSWDTVSETQRLVNHVLSHAPDRDQVPPGTGHCVCGCETFCAPRHNGPEDRLKNGLAPTCHRRFLRWRDQFDDPKPSVADYRTWLRRTREQEAEAS